VCFTLSLNFVQKSLNRLMSDLVYPGQVLTCVLNYVLINRLMSDLVYRGQVLTCVLYFVS